MNNAQAFNSGFTGRTMLIVLLTVIFIITSCSQEQPPVSTSTISMFVSGDALMSLPWSQYEEPEFLGLIDMARDADIAITNLEMLIHTYKGYAQANSCGTYMAASPEITDDLVWAGIDMVSNANNHTFDYHRRSRNPRIRQKIGAEDRGSR